MAAAKKSMARLISSSRREETRTGIADQYVDIRQMSLHITRMPEVAHVLQDMVRTLMEPHFYELPESQKSLILNTLREYDILKEYVEGDEMERPIKSESAADFFEYNDFNG